MQTYIVHRYNVLTTGSIVFEAWAPTSMHDCRFGTITTFDGQWFGKLGTETLPASIQALAVGPARFAACAAFRTACRAVALAVIRTAYPQIESFATADGAEYRQDQPVPLTPEEARAVRKNMPITFFDLSSCQ